MTALSTGARRSRPNTGSRLEVSPLVAPGLLALACVGVLVVGYPEILRRQSADSDIAVAYTLPEAIAHGHTGIVTLSTQGSWIQLGFGLLTHGLPFHRPLWELSAPAVALVTIAVIGWSVNRIVGRSGAILTVTLLLAASPTLLLSFTSASFHTMSLPGAALLDAYLVWLPSATPRRRTRVAGAAAMMLWVGGCLASDPLLLVIGVLPFLFAGFLVAFRTRCYRRFAPVAVVGFGAILVSHLVARLMYGLGFRVTTPGLRLGGAVGRRAGWLVDGLLRLGNGASVGAHPAAVQPLVVAAAIVAVGGLVSALVVGTRCTRRLRVEPESSARALHAAFWVASVVCACAAYVLTRTALEPSDRYFVIVVPAVAALLPLGMSGRWRTAAVAIGASIYAAASLAALASGELNALFNQGADVRYATRIEQLVAREHLGRGYAGYWDAASLEWSSGERLAITPLFGTGERTMPMFLETAADWYESRPGPSFLVLAPHDGDLPDRVPSDLPRPSRVFSLGDGVRIAAYRTDIAADLEPLPAH